MQTQIARESHGPGQLIANSNRVAAQDQTVNLPTATQIAESPSKLSFFQSASVHSNAAQVANDQKKALLLVQQKSKQSPDLIRAHPRVKPHKIAGNIGYQ